MFYFFEPGFVAAIRLFLRRTLHRPKTIFSYWYHTWYHNHKKDMANHVSKKKVAKKNAGKKSTKVAGKKATPKKWSKKVTETSDAMDLEQDVFKSKDPGSIARSVKRSAEKSNRRKAEPFQSAMSMINFYENRAGKNLDAKQKKVLDESKNELRKLYGREEQ